MNSKEGLLGRTPSCHLPHPYPSSEWFPVLAAPQLLIQASKPFCNWGTTHLRYFKTMGANIYVYVTTYLRTRTDYDYIELEA